MAPTNPSPEPQWRPPQPGGSFPSLFLCGIIPGQRFKCLLLARLALAPAPMAAALAGTASAESEGGWVPPPPSSRAALPWGISLGDLVIRPHGGKEKGTALEPHGERTRCRLSCSCLHGDLGLGLAHADPSSRSGRSIEPGRKAKAQVGTARLARGLLRSHQGWVLASPVVFMSHSHVPRDLAALLLRGPGLTMFITVSTYFSMFSLPWYSTILVSATTSVSTHFSLLMERCFILLFLCCFCSHLSLCFSDLSRLSWDSEGLKGGKRLVCLFFFCKISATLVKYQGFFYFFTSKT